MEINWLHFFIWSLMNGMSGNPFTIVSYNWYIYFY